ncbi:DUF2953 domain-containing protein [Candidatus Clostridium radicumherbarum]|uniref:DUF2953 domain-containing protein n=1 Tax=Candidatus Clostridium radicumherbarum TaxID=3381662 RepID=A0ABW8TTC6_9CLOT
MFYLYFILLVIIILLLIPIPIKLSIKYSSFNINFYLYNFKLNFDKLRKLYRKSEIKKHVKPLHKEKYEFDYTYILFLIDRIENIKLKPTIRFKFYCNYGFSEASSTAIAFGYINSISPFLYKLLNTPFKIKSYDFNIKPNFQGVFLESSINSIIFVNIIKIIYMIIFIRKKRNRSNLNFKLKNQEHNNTKT